VVVLELDAEHRVGKELDHPAAHFEKFFFRQASYLSDRFRPAP
jgi:hypothetical protein